jgi:hypothetical protein
MSAAEMTASRNARNKMMFAYNTCFNLANSAPRAGLYIQNAAVPTV